MSVVGIDLGTTNTVVGCVRTGKVHVLADEKGVRLLPSVVSFHPNGEVLVGAAAKARRVIDARHTVYSHKRLIGRSWGSPEITQAKNRFAFELREGPGQGPLIHARGQDYTLPEISAFVLKRARQIAERALGTPVERAVITVPAHFNELQRASTKVAGRVSGLEVLRILNEPTAAALAYGLGRTGNERVAVYDFGGGTFDCTLLDLNGNVFEVLATAGDSFLGGDDVDQMIADRMAEGFLKQHRQDPRLDPETYERLKTTAEDIKIALSTAESHGVMLKDLGHGAGGASLNFQFTMTRKDLDAMLTPLVDRSFKVTQDALTLARLSPSSFDKIILVGGSTRMPLIRKRVEAFFGGPPMDRVNPDEVVAIGAAIQAAALTEGIRRRSIPAPPGAMGQRPSQGDTQDNTQTSELDPSMLKPAFGSEPPAFGFASQQGSQPPGLGFASTIGSNPPITQQAAPAAPPAGVPGARAVTKPLRHPTNQGVAPATQPLGATQPMGARQAPPAKTQALEEDPSMASFPDLSAPTPFEWFPSSGQPSSGATQNQPVTSERTFGGSDPQTLTAAPQPARARADGGPGFGAIDEPPSLFSTPSTSVPSFPSMNTGGAAVPSPLGDVDSAPWRQEETGANPTTPGEGQFGALADLSLISTTGVSSPVIPEGGFGHVSDLSLISTQTATAAAEPITQARSNALDGDFEDATEAVHRDAKGRAIKLTPAAPPSERSDADEHDSMIDRTDLPAVVQRAKPARKPNQLGMSPEGGPPSMMGKAPPLLAPQPFGPMQKVDESSPHSRTAAMQSPQRVAGKAPPQIAKTGPGKLPTTAPMTTRGAGHPQNPLGATAPLGQGGPEAQPQRPPPPAAKPRPTTEAFGSPAQPPPFAHAPQTQTQGQGQGHAPPNAFPSAPPPFGQAPPPQPFSFGSAPPGPQPPQNQAFAAPAPQPFSQPPPQAYAPPQQPQPHGPPGQSQPPMFGTFASAPPGAPLDYAQGGFDPHMPPSPGPSQAIHYQTPVLVDVTPRGLVVETAGGYTDTIIPRNSKIPCERTRRFATGRDMQTTVRVRVAQGEGAGFGQNTFLGEVELSGLRPAPRGEVTVAVTFEVDADGTLRIRARDVQTGQEARATLQLIGVADESSVVMMINRFAHQSVTGGPTGGPTH